MAGYTIKKHEPYVITGPSEKTYEIPAVPNLSVDEIGYLVKFNDTTDPVEKTKICKEFFLALAPELAEEEIGDMEFFYIFENYNISARITPSEVGESSASRGSSKNTARR